MSNFDLVSKFQPTGDQPQAIAQLSRGVEKGIKYQTLLGVTGSGKTFTMANVIKNSNRPTLIISHNKTLAAQLAQEFKEFFPNNAVEYFVSYYDYYQPEAYIPHTDTYIEKETEINETIDKLRLSTTTSLLTRKDVIVVASVSCIYNIGSPVAYGKANLELRTGMKAIMKDILTFLASNMLYVRSDFDFKRGTFRVRGDTLDIHPSYSDNAIRAEFFGDKLDKLSIVNPLTAETITQLPTTSIYPAKHYVTPQDMIDTSLVQIKADLNLRLKELKQQNKEVEAYRLRQRTMYDMEMIKEFGFCNGIENYSRYFDGRKPGEAPYSLLNYFPKDYLLIVDESHITIPQIRGMYFGDRSRKETLIDYGFRLPSALDNRPLRFEEFMQRVNQVMFTSATPNEWEISMSNDAARQRGEETGVAEQLIHPTGLVDPPIDVRPIKGQIADLIAEIEQRVAKHERVLVTTLTKRMAEELASFIEDKGIKTAYLHADIETLKRTDILDDLRQGKFDVLVGINLLREGLDLPEVSLVAILDADKEGYLRSRTSLIQVMGRAARHVNGRVIMYADIVTGSMQAAIDEVNRRRKIQLKYNKKHSITPKTIEKPFRDRLIEVDDPDEDERESRRKKVVSEAYERALEGTLLADDKEKLVKHLQNQMREAAKAMEFEKAAILRDQIIEVQTKSRST